MILPSNTSKSSCVVREFPIPDREYRVSPPERRIVPPTRRTARRVRQSRRFLPLLAALALFCGGFLLGRAAAAEPPLPLNGAGVPNGADQGVPDGTIQPEEPTVRVLSLDEPDAAVWNLLLVNGEHPLPEDFAAPELTGLRNGQSVDSRIYPALQKMMDAARAAGYNPLVCSSFRTWEKQEQLFRNKVRRLMDQGYSAGAAEAEAARWVALPGTSEHQAGLAADIVDADYQHLDRAQEDRPVQQWLMAHCAEYGFVLRYPEDKSELTGIGYEPWHYRYVGEEAAAAIMEQGICLEEYLDRV